MKGKLRKNVLYHVMLLVSILFIAVGVTMVVQTFAHYNDLSLQRQDRQLEEWAHIADESMALELTNIRKDLIYVIGRRGFVNAAGALRKSGDAADLLTRMQDNLVMQNPLVSDMLLIEDDRILLSVAGVTDYYFPDGKSGSLRPCFSGDGSMYLAVIEYTDHGCFAALINMQLWYDELTRVNTTKDIRMMLLGTERKILLHNWRGENRVSAVEELTADTCDIQALRLMVESRTRNTSITSTYHLTYPGDSHTHEIRIAVIAPQECINGYFTLGLISDYDETFLPMHMTMIRLLVSCALLFGGLALLVYPTFRIAQQGRHRDRELMLLTQRNEEMQKLLDKTQELAHLQRLETIGTMTASIAHEFNNLLTPIMGYAILTLENLPPEYEDLTDNIGEIYDASRKAKEIIARLSALSRKTEESSCRVLSLKDLASKSMSVALPAQPANVSTRLDCTEDCIVSGSETQLSQLLLNLIINAYHAMEETGGTLTLHICREDGFAVMHIADTGMGISQESLPHIFEPFFTTKESRGTGLGLAIVYQVVENHQGEITVDSTPGKGTVFHLRLPLYSQDNCSS